MDSKLNHSGVVFSCLFTSILLVFVVFFHEDGHAIKPRVVGVSADYRVRIRVESGPLSETALPMGDIAAWNVLAECDPPTLNDKCVSDAPKFDWSVRVEYQEESDSAPVPSQFVPDIIPGPKGDPRAEIRGVFPDAGYWHVFVKVTATWHCTRRNSGCGNCLDRTVVSKEVSLDEEPR